MILEGIEINKNNIILLKTIIFFRKWKLVREVLLYKIGKLKKLVKSYRIINLLEYINKILEKIVINELLRIYEEKALLYSGQMGARKNKSTIDTVTLLIYKV